jgi:class 3 adenylate cyclase/tetratricopeptide (TPR) repeat protein
MSVQRDQSQALRAYLPRLVIHWIRETPEAKFREVDGSLAFVDISGFTKLTERLAKKGKVGAEELNDILDRCFTDLLAVAYADGAGLIKWGGDAVLLLFTGENHAARAARAAFRMRRKLREIGKIQTTSGVVVLRMSVGVHSGTFQFFLVGGSHRELIIAGRAATETVLMESTAEAGEVLVSQATAAQIEPQALGEPKGEGILLKNEPDVPSQPAEPAPEAFGLDLAACLPVAIRQHLLAGAPSPEHRYITVAFVEFRDTDAMIEREGLAETAEALEECMRIVQEATAHADVSFHETDISKDGGKILLVAGAPRSAGNDEERMLRAVREIMDRGGRIPMRIGVNAGRVFSGDFGPAFRRSYSIKGDAVNLAARIMGKAQLGEVLVTDAVLDVSPTTFQTEALEPFLVKGKKLPVQAYRLGRITGLRGDEDVELPLVGRDAEMEVIQDALDRARAGEGKVVEVIGPPGIGKTRLLHEVEARAHGRRALKAATDPYESATPYWLVRSVLRQVLEVDDAMPAAAVAARLRLRVQSSAPQLLPWLPLLATPLDLLVQSTQEVEQLTEQFRKERLEQVVEEFLGAVLDTPTLFAFEDGHWMDELSSDLLKRLSSNVGSRPWLIVVTRRDEETGFVAPESPDLRRLRPELLLESDAERLLSAATEESPLRPDELRTLAERSGGNPLFLRKLSGIARRPGGVEELPDSIEALVTAELDRLHPRDRLLLRHASVLGMSFSDELIASLLREESEEAAELLDQEAWRRVAGFLGEEAPGVRRFRHALMRDAIYEGLPYRRRRDLHTRAGEAILAAAKEGPEDVAELLSLHFFNAQRFGEAWIYSRIAGDRARAKYANADAALFYRRALEAGRKVTSEPAELASLYESLGDVKLRVGAYQESSQAYGAAVKLADDPARRGLLLDKQASVPYRAGRFAEAVALIRRGLRDLEGVDGPGVEMARHRLMAGFAGMRAAQGKNAEAERACRWLIARAGQNELGLGQTAEIRDALGRAYYLLDRVLVNTGRVDEAVNWKKALAIFEDLGDLWQQGAVLENTGTNLYFQGRWDEAVDLWERSRVVTLKTGDAVEAANLTNNVGEVLLDRGKVHEAELLFREVLRIKQAAGHVEKLAYAQFNLGRTAALSGEIAEGIGLLGQAQATFEKVGARYEAVNAEARIAECLLLQGNTHDALALISVIERNKGEEMTLLRPLLLRLRGYALAQAGRLDEARETLEESVAQSRASGAEHEVVFALDALARVASLTGTPLDDALLAEREEILDRLGIVSLPVIPLPALTPAGSVAPDR